METVEQLRAFRRDLAEAYYSGAREVKHGDKTTVFDSMEKMKSRLEAIDTLIASKRPSGRNFVGGKAYRPKLLDS